MYMFWSDPAAFLVRPRSSSAAATADFDNQIFELSGAASVSYEDIAASRGKALGRDVQYIPIPPAAVADGLRGMGFDAWLCNTTREYCEIYLTGWSNFITDSVQRITGHPARSIDDFAKDFFLYRQRLPQASKLLRNKAVGPTH